MARWVTRRFGGYEGLGGCLTVDSLLAPTVILSGLGSNFSGLGFNGQPFAGRVATCYGAVKGSWWFGMPGHGKWLVEKRTWPKAR